MWFCPASWSLAESVRIVVFAPRFSSKAQPWPPKSGSLTLALYGAAHEAKQAVAGSFTSVTRTENDVSRYLDGEPSSVTRNAMVYALVVSKSSVRSSVTSPVDGWRKKVVWLLMSAQVCASSASSSTAASTATTDPGSVSSAMSTCAGEMPDGGSFTSPTSMTKSVSEQQSSSCPSSTRTRTVTLPDP